MKKTLKSNLAAIAYSVLDLAGVSEGLQISDVFKNSVSLAQTVEELGYSRFWLAEHHNMESVASSATSVLIGHIAEKTTQIRVGSGGIMLPNHTPLIIAEQFGTLATLYPNRIDLGVGRAPGTDQITAQEIRGERYLSAQNFPHDVLKLLNFLGEKNTNNRVRAIPGEGTNVPVWILGSSMESAKLAATFGLPYAFASHFAPHYFYDAVSIYKDNFRPSEYLQNPYVISCVNVIAADTDDKAEFLSSSVKILFAGIISNQRKLLQAPVSHIEDYITDVEAAAIEQMLSISFIGGKSKIKKQINDFLEKSEVDELMVCSHIFNHTDRLESYRIFAEIMNENSYL